MSKNNRNKSRAGSSSKKDAGLQEAIHSISLLENLTPALFNEAVSTHSELELLRDEAGWLRVSNINDSMLEMDSDTRSKIVAASRKYWHRDPISKHVVRLWTAYGIGTGMSFKAKRAANQRALTEFTNSRANRKLFSAMGQQKSSNRLLVDGEVFFIFFNRVSDDERVIRRLEPLHVVELITDPDDDETVVAYARQKGIGTKREFIRDWAAEEFDFSSVKDSMKNKVEPVEDVFIYHAAFDTLHHRGNPLLTTIIDWAKELRRFMEGRVAVVQALARWAYKLKLQGGKTALTSIKNQLETTLNADDGDEDNPPPAAGSIALENSAATLSAMPRQTGASGARDDADNLKLMVAAGTSVFLHYLGDPSTGNLATSTSMELPMLKTFQMYQQFWTDVYLDLFSIILEDDDAEIDLDWPPIIEKDLTMLSSALASLNSTYPALMAQPELQLMVLSALGINNADKIIRNAEKLRKEREEEMKAQLAANGPPNEGDEGNDEDPVKKLDKTVEALTEALRG